MKQLLFLCISLAILLFSVIVINVAPIIKGKVGGDWSFYACKMYSDSYNIAKKVSYPDSKTKDAYLDPIKKAKTRCDRRKAMNGLEYVTANLNILFGFICAFAGFLVYQKIGNLGGDSKYIGLIGLGCGVIGFVLTLVYVIESGLIFTDLDIDDLDDDDDRDVRIDSDGAFLEWDSGKKKYTCIFYKKDKEDSVYLRYSDYNKKYLNYYKDISFDNNDKYYIYHQCRFNNIPEEDLFEYCEVLEKNTYQEIQNDNEHSNYLSSLYENPKHYYPDNDSQNQKDCKKLLYLSYYDEPTTSNYYKIIYDYWVTSLIFSCLIMVLYIGLAIFGFLLFKDGGSNGSSGPVSIK